VALTIGYPPDTTPLDPDEAKGLIPEHIHTHGELNEWEQENIVEGETWAFARRRKNILTPQFVDGLHRRMFGRTWRWAGQHRTTEKNIGIDPARCAEEPVRGCCCTDREARVSAGGDRRPLSPPFGQHSPVS